MWNARSYLWYQVNQVVIFAFAVGQNRIPFCLQWLVLVLSMWYILLLHLCILPKPWHSGGLYFHIDMFCVFISSLLLFDSTLWKEQSYWYFFLSNSCCVMVLVPKLWLSLQWLFFLSFQLFCHMICRLNSHFGYFSVEAHGSKTLLGKLIFIYVQNLWQRCKKAVFLGYCFCNCILQFLFLLSFSILSSMEYNV